MSKTAKITLHKEAILADIDALTFKRVDGVLSGESDQVKNAVSSDSSEDLDKYILARHIDTRDANLRERLTFCLQDSDDELSADNLIDSEDKLEYNLKVPDTFNGQRLKALARKMHNYILNGIICDWYAAQNMKGNLSEEQLEVMEDEIVAMLRTSFVKRPLQPFGPR